jgi:hypothetical protein
MRAKVDSPYLSQGDGIKVLSEMPRMSRHDGLQVDSPKAHVADCRAPLGCPLY